MGSARRSVVAVCAALLAASGCTSKAPERRLRSATVVAPTSPAGASSIDAPPSTVPTRPESSARTHPTPPASAAERALKRMGLAERVGQLLMVDCPSSGVAGATLTAVRAQHVGSVILDGNSTLGVIRTHAITDQLQALASDRVGLFVATDQEGGLVQRMRGPGFSSIPSAVEQGGYPPSSLRASARMWGRQLRAAGINLDLAPVLDTVPPDSTGNPPIADLDREYGRTTVAVTSHGSAVAQGLADARVAAAVKHFPGLGRVRGNTDTSAGVTDYVTTRHDPYLAPFAAAIKRRVPFVMMSTAIYARIDATSPAAFSPAIVGGMLRHDLGFTGVIISDDVGAAAQVSRYSPAARAVAFIRAGGDIVLTVDPGVVAEMATALRIRASRDPAFSELVDAAALVVLRAKESFGLLH